MKVALVHYWLVGMRGGEKVVEALIRMFPGLTIFTHAYNPDAVSDLIKAQDVRTTFINRLPRSGSNYKSYLPLMPLALEQIDLRGFDLVISSESGPAKGIVPPPTAMHICYCHSPMRYIWNMFHEYRDNVGTLSRFAIPPLAHYIRNWDAVSASRVDSFVANSAAVKARVERYYGRHAEVIYPPVDLDHFSMLPPQERGDYYLMVGELVPYKRPDLAVRAFNELGEHLTVIGGGELLDMIQGLAGPTVRVLGPQPFASLRHHYARCKALIFPGEEDFGIVPVEAMASGRPVIAFGRGGALETVQEGVSGVFFHEQSVEAIVRAVRVAQAMDFDPAAIVRHTQRFSTEQFVLRMTRHIDDVLSRGRAPDTAPRGAQSSVASMG